MTFWRFWHKLRWYLDPWYRRRIRKINKAIKQFYGPIIISGIYRESPLMQQLSKNRVRPSDTNHNTTTEGSNGC